MTTGKALNGKPYAGNPHVRFDEGEVASAATPRRGSLLYKPFARIILVSSLAFATGCVSRIDIEHWTLEPCDAATTAEIARFVEEGASRDSRVWNDNVPYEERERRETAGVGNPNAK